MEQVKLSVVTGGACPGRPEQGCRSAVEGEPAFPETGASTLRYGAFPLHGTVRFGTAWYGTVRLSSGRFAFPPQFSTTIEWAGLFMRRYNCAASTAVTSS